MDGYHPIPSDRMDDFSTIWQYAFNPTAGRVTLDSNDSIEATRVGEQRGIFKDGDLVAICRHHFLESGLRNEYYQIGCLGSVATPPEYRGKGYSRELMLESLHEYRDKGIFLCVLWPFDYQFYSHYGWTLTNTFSVQEFPPDSLRFQDHSPAGSYVRLTPDDYKRMQDVLTRASAEYNLNIIRSEAWWKEGVFHRKGDRPHIYGWEENGTLTGYVAYGVLQNDRTVLRILEAPAVDYSAKTALLRFLANHESQVDTIRLYGPPDSRLFPDVTDPSSVKLEIKPGPMARLVDVEKALKTIGYPSDVDGNLTLRIRDDFATWNDATYRLDIDSGSPEVHSCDDDPDVTIDIQSLTSLLVGTQSIDELSTRNTITIHQSDHRNFLATAFPPHDVYLREKF